jgi:hypothetical protein
MQRIFVGFISVFIFLAPYSLMAEYISPEEEAPEALIQTSLGDADVGLFLKGSWGLSLTGSLGYGYNTETKITEAYPFPDFAQGFQFKQVPDITLSLWLMNRFFLETSFKEDSESNTFLLGYRTTEEEFLRSVLIGNTDIEIDSYSFLKTAKSPPHSLGGSAHFESRYSKHEILVRYDPSTRQEKHYLGSYERIQQEKELSSYLQGRYFLLPDKNVDDLEVYIADPDGSFRDSSNNYSYRKLGKEEAVISSEDGIIYTDERCTGRLLVYYTKDGKSVGHPSLGRDFLCGTSGVELDPQAEPVDFSWNTTDYLGMDMNAFKVTVDGKACLMVYDPGTFSPFEYQGAYKVSLDIPEESWKVKAKLVDKGDLTEKKEEVTIRVDPEEDLVKAFSTDTDIRDPVNRYPFAGRYPFLYGTQKNVRSGYVDSKLDLQVLQETDGYILEEGVIPGSITVRINGRQEDSFTYDQSSGEITFYTYIHPEDEIDISYRTSHQGQGGNLVAGIGNRFFLTPHLTLDLSTGARWNVLSSQYTTEAGQNPGSVVLGSGLFYEKENLRSSLEAALSFSTPDTTGTMRILGMEQDGIPVGIDQRRIRPSSIPEGTLDEGGSVSISRDNRAPLYYRDYNSYSILGFSQLMPYSWSPPQNQIYDYETGSKPGPFIVSPETEQFQGNAMVMDYFMNQNKKWAGAQIPLPGGGESEALNAINSLTFYWRSEDLKGETPQVFVHIGTISEDLDGDNTLDSESSEYDSGYPFNDPSNGATLFIGGGPQNSGNMVIDTEDADNDGILDRENDELIIKRELSAPGKKWKLATIMFTEQEKKILQQASAIRIVLFNSGGEKAKGSLLFGGITLVGSSFKAKAHPSGSVQAQEVTENQSLHPPPKEIQEAYPQVTETFHPLGEIQQVLEVDWDSIPEEGNWKITGYTTELPLSQYRYLSFYLRTAKEGNAASGRATLAFTGNDGQGLHCRFPLENTGKWQKYSVDIQEQTLYADGAEVEESRVTKTPTSGTLSEFHLSVKNSQTGTLYVDEIHLEETYVQTSGALQGSIEYTIPGPVLEIDSVSLLSDITIRESGSIVGEDFATEYGEAMSGSTLSSKTELSWTMLFTNFSTDIGIVYSIPDLFLSGGHQIQFPAFSFPVSVSDRYSENNTAAGNTFSRGNTLNINLPPVLSLNLSTRSSYLTDILDQNWNVNISSLWQIPLSLDMSGTLNESSSRYPVRENVYFENWIHRYELIVPLDTDPASERSFNGSFDFAVTTTPVGFTLTPHLGYSVSGTTERRQINRGGISLAFPLSFAQETPVAWSITPGYSRTFSYSLPAATGTDFGYDFELYCAGFASQDYIYTTYPGEDIFSPGVKDDFSGATDTLAHALFTPSFSLTVSRTAGSYLRDLFIPSKADFSLSRSLEKVEDSLSDTLSWSASLRNEARNLFGRLGLYPVFGFYETEEIQLMAKVSMDFEDSSAPTETKLIVQNNFSFFGKTHNELLLENRFSYTWADWNRATDEAKISYSWSVPPSFPIDLPLIPARLEKNPYFLHTESLELKFAENNSSELPLIYTTIIKHTTGLMFPEFGKIEAHLSFGLSRNDPSLIQFGFRGGLEGKISF